MRKRTLIILCAIAAVAAMELAAWKSGLCSQSTKLFMRDTGDPELPVELTPGADLEFGRGWCIPLTPTHIHISEQGLRDRAYSIAKPPGAFRAAGLGDSLAFGWGVEEKQTFYSLLENRLNEPGRLPANLYSRAEVINFSVPGYDLPQYLAQLNRRVTAFSPDLVLLPISDNDLHLSNRLVPPRWVGALVAAHVLRPLYFGFQLAMNAWKEWNPGPYHRPESIGPTLQEAARIADGIGAAVLVFTPRPDNRYVDRIRQEAAAAGLSFVDAGHELAAFPRREVELRDAHLSPLGHSLVAEALFIALKQTIEIPSKE